MDPQLKRGFLEACVLASLQSGESYGYRIIKSVPAPLELTESTLYPLLKRLEAEGSIVANAVEHNGRLRKYYRLTSVGEERIERFLAGRTHVEEIYGYIESRRHTEARVDGTTHATAQTEEGNHE